MTVELDRTGLEALVKGSRPYYTAFNHPLVLKAGHEYNDQQGRTRWNNLSGLEDHELYKIYQICRESWT